MAYNKDEIITLSSVGGGSIVFAVILVLLLVFLRRRGTVGTGQLQVAVGLFLFVIVLPAIVLSTLVNATLLETQEAIDVTCPSYCRSSGRGTGRSISNLSNGAISVGVVGAVVIGVGLWLAHRVRVVYLRYDTILKIYAFLFGVMLLPGLVASTTVSSTMREDIQLLMGTRNCSGCAGAAVSAK